MAKYTPTSNVTTKTEFSAEFTKIANAINDQLDRTDATSNQLTVDLDVNGKKLLNVPAPTVDTDVVRMTDVPGLISSFFDASNFTYDNSTSLLTATNVQDAIDELDAGVDLNKLTLDNFGPRLNTAEADIDQLETDVAATNMALANESARIDSNDTDITNLQNDKADKDVSAVVDNLAVFNASGNPVDGGLSIDDILNTAPTFVQEAMPTGTIDEGATWYNPTLATTFIYYVDTDSSQWVETGFSLDTSGGVAQTDFDNLSSRVTSLEDTRGTAATADVQTSSDDTTAGRVLTVGAGGLLGAGLVKDWNLLSDSTLVSSATNAPGAVSHYGVHIQGDNPDFASQFKGRNDKFYVRTKESGAWQPERELWTDGNLEKQSSATDATSGRVLTVGAFGLGVNATTAVSDAHTLLDNGFYSGGGGSGVNYPDSAARFAPFLVMGRLSGSQTQSNLYVGGGPSQVRSWITRTEDGGTTWGEAELYSDDNLNVREFGGVATDDRVAVGEAISTTSALFYLHTNTYGVPADVTVEGTFKVWAISNSTTYGTGLGDADFALFSTRSNRLVPILVSNLSGLTAGQSVHLVTESSTSKLTIVGG